VVQNENTQIVIIEAFTYIGFEVVRSLKAAHSPPLD
jgi:hypothetical protein